MGRYCHVLGTGCFETQVGKGARFQPGPGCFCTLYPMQRWVIALWESGINTSMGRPAGALCLESVRIAGRGEGPLSLCLVMGAKGVVYDL